MKNKKTKVSIIKLTKHTAHTFREVSLVILKSATYKITNTYRLEDEGLTQALHTLDVP